MEISSNNYLYEHNIKTKLQFLHLPNKLFFWKRLHLMNLSYLFQKTLESLESCRLCRLDWGVNKPQICKAYLNIQQPHAKGSGKQFDMNTCKNFEHSSSFSLLRYVCVCSMSHASLKHSFHAVVWGYTN